MANEAATAEEFVSKVMAECQDLEDVSFFTVLDQVSKDGTWKILQSLAGADQRLKPVWAPENRSVVDAYVRGYREALQAGCDWILEIDGGFSHRPQDIPKFLAKMAEGYDCVFGTRFSSGGRIEKSSIKRKYISRGGTLLTNLLLGTQLSDMTSGFEMFTREVLAAALPHIHSRGPFFQTEIKTFCHRYRYAEVPIVYQMASHQISNASLKDAFSNLWRLFRQRRLSEKESNETDRSVILEKDLTVHKQ